MMAQAFCALRPELPEELTLDSGFYRHECAYFLLLRNSQQDFFFNYI